MNVDYSIYFDLYEPYTKSNIFTILEKGKEMGILYFEDYIYFKKLTVDQALKILYTPNHKDFDCENLAILIKFKDMGYTFLTYKNEKDKLELVFFDFWMRWKKEFRIGSLDPYPYFDLSRCLRLFLKLLKGFKIKKITTEIEY